MPARAYRLAHVDAMPEVLDDAEKAALHKQRLRLEALVTKGSDTKVPPDTTDEELVNMLAQYMPMTLCATAGAARAEECASARTSADRSDRVEAGAYRLRAVMHATWPAWLVHAYTGNRRGSGVSRTAGRDDTEFPGGVSVVVRCRAGGQHRRTIGPPGARP